LGNHGDDVNSSHVLVVYDTECVGCKD